MSYKSVFFSLLIGLTFFSSCKKDKKLSGNAWEYREYVSSFTNGVVSKTSPIEVKFSQEVTKYQVGDKLPNSILSSDPNIKGELSLINPYTLVFQPSQGLKSGTTYTIEVKIKQLFDKVTIKKPFQFSFQTIEPNFSVLIDEFQNDPDQEGKQILLGHVETSDIMSFADVDKLLTASQNGKRLPVQFENQDDGKFFNYTVQNIERFDESSEVEIAWNGKSLGIKNEGSQTIKIPSVNTMDVVQISVENQPNQVLKINFSDEIDQNQRFDGLVEIDSVSNLTFSVNGNILSVFPDQNLSGETEIRIFEGIKSVDGKTSQSKVEMVIFEAMKPAVRWINEGTILPDSDGLHLNFEAVSLQAVDIRVTKIFQSNVLQFLQVNSLGGENEIKRVGRPVAIQRLVLSNIGETNKWRAYSVDLSPLINYDFGSIYHVEISFRPEYSTFNCGAEIKELSPDVEVFSDDTYWDNETYYDAYWDWEEYNWQERDNPCSSAYYGSSRSIATNLLASNLGVIVKENENNSLTVITSNLVTAEPQVSAEVNFYNYQLQLLRKTKTNADGIGEYSGTEKVAFVEVKHNNQSGYVQLDDGKALMTSQFAVNGYQSKKGLKGYIYGERGIWRPGDDIYLNFILNDADNPLPAEHPVKFTLKNPQGLVVDEQLVKESVNGFYRFTTKTDQSAITGNYLANVKVGSVSFTKSIPVENIKPNRLKINFETKNKQGFIESKWLHGAPASDLKATVDVTLRSEITKFDKFPNYVFDDPATEFETEEKQIYDGTLDANGNTSFNLGFQDDIKAPGKLKATYITKVYEKGGSFSIDAFSEEFSPYSSYVGILAPESKNYYQQLDTDQAQSFQVVTVDESGQPMAVNGVEVEIYEVGFRWWWNESDENLSSYVSSQSKTPIFTTTVNTNSQGKASFQFQVNYPDWGRYLVRLKNPSSGHFTGTTVYFDWPSWRGRSQKDGSDAANLLSFTTDKEEYQVGETIEINFPSSQSGRALVSIENGTKVLDAFWVKPDEEFTKVKVKATAEMAPNIYFNITYIQPHSQTQNDRPIRLYGIVPVSVYNKESKLEPVIQVKNTLRPEEKYTVTVKEAKGKPMTYTLAVVDEGLLDLTRFKTPNAWDDFYQKQALGVRTWDMYDEVIGAYSGRIDQLFSIGGGDAAQAAGAKKAQRFKPVVTYLGPFKLPANGKGKHELEMPNYVGSVRVMVVAGDVTKQAYGSAEETVAVKKPLMIIGTMPRVVSPGEDITLPVSVFAMENKVKNVSLSVSTNDLLQIAGSSQQSIQFNQPGEQEVYFQLKAPDKTGVATVEVIATGGGERSTYSVELDVVNPNEAETRVQNFELSPNGSYDVIAQAFGMQGSNTAKLQFSSLPNLNFAQRLDYLIQYPHGCAEQVTSAAFPQLFLNDIVDLTAEQQQQAKQNVQKAIQRLRSYQSSNGGFAYWPGANETDDYASNYVGHFLVKAKEKGYDIPFGMLENWKQYQQSQSRMSHTTSSYSSFNQAYRLYTLAIAGSPDLSAMNRLRERSNLSVSTRWRLAAAYAAAGQQQNAKQLINVIKDDVSSYDRYQIYGSPLRNEAMALETSVLLGNDQLSQKLATSVGKQLGEDKWYSTQTTAYSLLALSEYLQKRGGKGFTIDVLVNGKSISVQSKKAFMLVDLPDVNQSDLTINIKNKGSNQVFAQLISEGVPLMGQEQATSRNLSLSVSYKDLEDQKIDVLKLPQATEFYAEITVKNLSNYTVKNVALTQQIPSGWEIVNTRYAGVEQKTSAVDYTDIRDDRVHYYFDLKSQEEKQFRILVNSSFLGKYYLPGSIVEAMYDHDYYAKNSGYWIEIVE